MTARLLPRAEWGKLEAFPEWPMIQAMPEEGAVLVAEEDGAIVGLWCAFPVWHLHGLRIDPAHRRRGGTARRLLRSMTAMLRGRGITRVTTGTTSNEAAGYLKRLGATTLPGEQLVWAIGEQHHGS